MIGQSTHHLFRSFRQVRAQKLHFLQNVLHVHLKEVDNRVGSLLHCPKYNLNLGTKKETGAALQMQWYRSGFSDLTVYLAQKTDKLYHCICFKRGRPCFYAEAKIPSPKFQTLQSNILTKTKNSAKLF